ncbi:MAG: 2-amino-4-hydroxy-6-hydroxymethyldihydropteridine diphosphokinase [Pseudomonadota bacterium]
MTEALVALGSNLGDRRSHMEHGLARLAALPETRLSAVSTLYETAPVGGPDNQGPYLNAVARVQTGLDARALLAALHTIEAERERERVVRWAARTLDLDLLTHGDTVAEDGDLTVPHPRMHERRFVMVPVCDVAADMAHPRLQRPMSAILADLPVEPGDLTGLDSAWYTQILHPTE